MINHFQIRSSPDIHTEYSDSRVPLCEDYLYFDPDYPVQAYASWFLQNRPWDFTEWFVRFTPKSHQFPRMSTTWSHGRSSSHFPEKPLNRNSLLGPDVVVILFLTHSWHFGLVPVWKRKFLSPHLTYHQCSEDYLKNRAKLAGVSTRAYRKKLNRRFQRDFEWQRRLHETLSQAREKEENP